jgi:hypothetical protein
MSLEHDLMRLLKHPKGHLVHVSLCDHSHGVRISVSNMCNEILWHVASTPEEAVEYALKNFESALKQYAFSHAQRMLKSIQESHAETERQKVSLKRYLTDNKISRSSLTKKKT